MSDGLRHGRSLRLKNMADNWSRFRPVIEVDRSRSAQRVIRALERARELYSLAISMVTDHDPKFSPTAFSKSGRTSTE